MRSVSKDAPRREALACARPDFSWFRIPDREIRRIVSQIRVVFCPPKTIEAVSASYAIMVGSVRVNEAFEDFA